LAHNGTFEQEYAKDAKMAGPNFTTDREQLTPSKLPLTYIANWNGNFFNDRLQTRWAWGLQTQAKGKYSRMLSLGQRLNLPKLQWYIDYSGAVDELDRLRIASGELALTRVSYSTVSCWALTAKGSAASNTTARDNRNFFIRLSI